MAHLNQEASVGYWFSHSPFKPGSWFDLELLQSFGLDYKPWSHDKFPGQKMTRTYCDEAGVYAVPNVFSQRDLICRPDLSDINWTSITTFKAVQCTLMGGYIKSRLN